MMRRLVYALVALLLGALPVDAQARSRLLIEGARAQIDELNPDSAVALIGAALAVPMSQGERLRAFTVLAFIQLLREDRVAARRAFEEALRLDRQLRIDSLADLHSDAPVVFAEARSVVLASAAPAPAPAAPRPVLTLAIEHASDTTLEVESARYMIRLRPSWRARMVASVAAADRVIWTDTQTVAGSQEAGWPLAPGGVILPDGRYTLRLQAQDSTGQSTSVHERVLLVARLAPDTQPLPAPLAHTSFAPETLAAAVPGNPRTLLAGVVLGGLVAGVPLVLGNKTLNDGLSRDPMAFGVAGSVTLASVVGFFHGRSAPKLSAEAIEQNRRLRESHRQQVDSITIANARARALAPIRITVEQP